MRNSNIERKIYSSFVLDGNSTETGNYDENIKVYSNDKLDLHFLGKKEKIQRENADQEKVLKIGNDEYKLFYQSTNQKLFENKIKPSISLDIYKSDVEYGNTILAYFDSESGKLVQFNRFDSKWSEIKILKICYKTFFLSENNAQLNSKI